MDRVSAELIVTNQPGRSWASARARLVLLVVATMACACRPAAFAYTSASPEALASAVLESLAAGDAARLARLAVSEAEFHSTVWPELPAARPERNLPADYVWRDLRQKSAAGLRLVVARYGGRRWTLLGVEFEGDTSHYGPLSISRRTVVRVRDDAGAEHRVRLFGSMLRHRGRFKVFSYVID